MSTNGKHDPTAPSPFTQVVFQQLGNAAQRVPPNATAFNRREAQYELMMLSMWLDPSAYEANVQWTRRLAEAIHPFTTGRSYVNHMGMAAEEGVERIKTAYGTNYQRLVDLKSKYDPTNLFRHNQNIKPTV